MQIEDYIKAGKIAGEVRENVRKKNWIGVTLEEIPPPNITLTDEAKDALMSAVANAVANDMDAHVFFEITEQFQYDIYLDQARTGNIVVSFGELHLSFSRGSAKRANGMKIGFVADQGFSIENPNEPAQVKHMSVDDLKSVLDSEQEIFLFDVRTDEEQVNASDRLDANGE